MLKPNVESLEAKAEPTISSIVAILTSLTSPDSLKIFIRSEKGISSSTRTIKELGLSQKRYYVWLKRLIDAGLVEKKSGIYYQTFLGKVCYRLGLTLQDTIIQKDRLQLADTLMKTDTLSLEEREDLLYKISGKGLGASGLMDILHEVNMIVNYDIFIEEVITLLDKAKKSAYVVANKTDFRVMESTFKIIDKGLNFFFISSKETGFSESIQALRMLLNPASIKIIRKLISSKDLNIRILENLTHSFVVTDGEFGIVELPHPTTSDFYVAFKFRNSLFCQKLLEVFNSLYQKGKEDPRLEFVKKTLGYL